MAASKRVLKYLAQLGIELPTREELMWATLLLSVQDWLRELKRQRRGRGGRDRPDLEDDDD